MMAARHNPCATCGLCCRAYIVPVSGYDVWLISTTQNLRPAAFVIGCPQTEPDGTGFQLERDGPTFFLALDKQGRFQIKGPCVFLVQLGGGHERCGIYAHRPVVCQVYPMQPQEQVLTLRSDALCAADAWPPETQAWPSWRAALQRQRMSFDLYTVVVSRWNQRMAEVEPGQTARLDDYAGYLLNVYDRLATLARQVGPAGMAEIERTWNSRPPGTEGVPLGTLLEQASLPWLDYLVRARGIVQGVFPNLPPLAPLRVVSA